MKSRKVEIQDIYSTEIGAKSSSFKAKWKLSGVIDDQPRLAVFADEKVFKY